MLSAARSHLRASAGRIAKTARGVSGIANPAPASAIWGDYSPLDPSSAMTTYPEPLPVPDQIRRPAYVPDNFFTHPIWEHSEPKEEEAGGPIQLGSHDEHLLRRTAGTVADILAEMEKHVKVRQGSMCEVVYVCKLTPSPASPPRSSTTSLTTSSLRGGRIRHR